MELSMTDMKHVFDGIDTFRPYVDKNGFDKHMGWDPEMPYDALLIQRVMRSGKKGNLKSGDGSQNFAGANRSTDRNPNGLTDAA